MKNCGSSGQEVTRWCATPGGYTLVCNTRSRRETVDPPARRLHAGVQHQEVTRWCATPGVDVKLWILRPGGYTLVCNTRRGMTEAPLASEAYARLWVLARWCASTRGKGAAAEPPQGKPSTLTFRHLILNNLETSLLLAPQGQGISTKPALPLLRSSSIKFFK